MTGDWIKTKADMAAGIAIPGHELNRVIQENSDLEELGLDCPVHGPDGVLSLIHISEPTRPY